MNRVAIPLDLAPSPTVGEGVMATLSGPTMGVSWTAKALLPPHRSLEEAQATVQAALDGVVAQMSTWEPGSDISRYNRARAGAWVSLPPDFQTVLECALDLAEGSDGAFDPTIGALVDLWGFGPAGPRDAPPSDAAVAGALDTSGRRRLTLDRAGGRALQPGGLQLDLSGIAKGFGVDKAAHALEALGVANYLVEIGGELRGAGLKPDGQPWWVEIETPPGETLLEQPLIVALHDLSMATSGDYRRFLTHGADRLGHTLDPRTGRPLSSAAASVTVLHRQCLWADALCTLLTVLGPADGLEYARRAAIPARFLLRTPGGLEERLSPAFAAMLD